MFTFNRLSFLNITGREQVKQKLRYYLQLAQTGLDSLRLSYYGKNESIVVLFGDSRAKAWPTPPDFSQFEFINRGISNDTSAQVLSRCDKHVKPISPQFVILQVGINDFRPLALSTEYKETIITNCKKNIWQIVRGFTNIGGSIVILTTVFPIGNEGPPSGGPFWSPNIAQAVSEVNSYIRTLEGPNVIIFDAYSILADDNGFLHDRYILDPLHLNSLGYDVLNNELAHIITTCEVVKYG